MRRKLLVLASQEVIDLLLDEESDNLAQLQTFVDRSIRFSSRVSLYARAVRYCFDVIVLIWFL